MRTPQQKRKTALSALSGSVSWLRQTSPYGSLPSLGWIALGLTPSAAEPFQNLGLRPRVCLAGKNRQRPPDRNRDTLRHPNGMGWESCRPKRDRRRKRPLRRFGTLQIRRRRSKLKKQLGGVRCRFFVRLRIH